MNDEYAAVDWHRESYRIRFAVLKLISGNIQDLRLFLEWTRYNYCDMLSSTECQLAMKKSNKVKNMYIDEVESLYKKDLEYYKE
jgi:hypothetical protein